MNPSMLRAAARLLLAWAVLLSPLAAAQGMGGCPRCGDHCPMRSGTSHAMPCHASTHAPSETSPSGCAIRGTCAHTTASLPAGSSEALLVPELVLSPVATNRPAPPSRVAGPANRGAEPPTDPPRIAVA